MAKRGLRVPRTPEVFCRWLALTTRSGARASRCKRGVSRSPGFWSWFECYLTIFSETRFPYLKIGLEQMTSASFFQGGTSMAAWYLKEVLNCITSNFHCKSSPFVCCYITLWYNLFCLLSIVPKASQREKEKESGFFWHSLTLVD